MSNLWLFCAQSCLPKSVVKNHSLFRVLSIHQASIVQWKSVNSSVTIQGGETLLKNVKRAFHWKIFSANRHTRNVIWEKKEGPYILWTRPSHCPLWLPLVPACRYSGLGEVYFTPFHTNFEKQTSSKLKKNYGYKYIYF